MVLLLASSDEDLEHMKLEVRQIEIEPCVAARTNRDERDLCDAAHFRVPATGLLARILVVANILRLSTSSLYLHKRTTAYTVPSDNVSRYIIHYGSISTLRRSNYVLSNAVDSATRKASLNMSSMGCLDATLFRILPNSSSNASPDFAKCVLWEQMPYSCALR